MASNLITGLLSGTSMDPTTLVAFMIVMIIFVLLAIAIYIYSSFAFMAIGKKAKVSSPGLAWIPCLGPCIIAYNASKMNARPWWGFLAGFILFIAGFVFMAIGGGFVTGIDNSSLVISVILFALGCVAFIYFSVYEYIWNWKLFIVVGRPGWWGLIPLIGIPLALLALIPIIGLVFSMLNYAVSAWYMVMVGITAWGQAEKPVAKRTIRRR